jgi:AcrR family transcriptional regulator
MPETRTRRRADAERNAAAILAAATRCLSENPDASMEQIARAAGVTRATLYAHVESREALIEEVVGRAVEETVAAVDRLDLDTGPAGDALARLIGSGWQQLDGFHNVFLAADRALEPHRLRARHAAVLDRIDGLIERGQRSGEFGGSLPRSWLVGCLYELIHLAARDVQARRVTRAEAGDLLTRSALALVGATDRS